MATKKQISQDRYDQVLPLIQEAANQYYAGNLDRGFRHWAFALVFGSHGIQDTDVLDATRIDGADDFEIDGWLIPEPDDDRAVNLFQAKHRQPGTTMGAKELAPFLNAPDRILSDSQVIHAKNEETKELHDQIVRLVAHDDRRCTLNLVWVTSGTISGAAQKVAADNSRKSLTKQIGNNTYEFSVTLDCWDLERLYQEYKMQLESDSPISSPCDVEFQLNPGSYHQVAPEGEDKTLFMTIPVGLIIEAFRSHTYNLFRLNPRGPLGNTINREMRLTLTDDTRKKRFHLFNNGMTAICKGWDLDAATHRLTVRDLQIVNGCQTTVTLWDARTSIQHDPDVLVSIKLSECPEDLAKTIASTTNTQATIKAEDRVSNEVVQNRLKAEFSTLEPSWFYQVKRGEWTRMIGGQSEKRRYLAADGTYRYLTAKEVAQAVLAFAGFPGEAKDRIRHFLDKANISSIAREGEINYERIYTDSLSAKQLLLPASIQRKIWARVAQEKDTKPWLDYARFQLVWLIGRVLRNHYGLEGHVFPTSRAETLSEQIDHWFSSLYDVVEIAIATTRDQAENRGEYRGHREFFRSASNYRLMESNLQGALQLARNFHDPMAQLPE